MSYWNRTTATAGEVSWRRRVVRRGGADWGWTGFLLLLGLLGSGRMLAQTGRFDSEIGAFEAQDRLRPPPDRPHLFVGSSTIRLWTGLASAFPGVPVLNRGFGGSEMSDVLHYFDRVVLPYRPEVVWVYEGDNDLAAGGSPIVVAGRYAEFIARIQRDLPGTEVVLLAVKPSPSRIGLIAAQRDLNQRLQDIADSHPGVAYIDLFTPMLGSGGAPRPELYLSDALHLSPAGYAIWERVVREHLELRSGSVRRSVLIDFGPAATVTRLGGTPDDPVRIWNQVTTEIGTMSGAGLTNLVTDRGMLTGMGLWMESRFNAANSSGTVRSGRFPPRATMDSLFGNTAGFGGLSDVRPILLLTGLNPGQPLDLTFHASRLSADDRREALYRVEGAEVWEATLDASNNDDRVATLSGVRPTAEGTLRIRILPGSGNNNANRFIYLGVLGIEWMQPVISVPQLTSPELRGGRLHFRVEGMGGQSFKLQKSTDLKEWVEIETTDGNDASPGLSVPIGDEPGFLRIWLP